MENEICSICGKEIIVNNFLPFTGYGLDKDNKIVCYECCAYEDKAYMILKGKNTLYYNEKDNIISNFPGTLKITPYTIKKGKHNFAGIRTDVWFKFNKKIWHGINYGYNSELLYCKVTKY